MPWILQGFFPRKVLENVFLWVSYLCPGLILYAIWQLKWARRSRGCLFNLSECAKFRESRAIVGLAGLVPLCHRAFVGPKYFLMGISCVPLFFLVGISWVQDFFSWVFLRFKMFRFLQYTLVKIKEKYMVADF